MDDPSLGIQDVSEATGLSKDTLRWYEKEGLVPSVPRGADGRRRYDPRTVSLVRLLARLRRTGMPVAQVKAFVALIDEGAASHGRRVALLREHRARLDELEQQLHADIAAVEAKIAHYEGLIATGRDCLEDPIADPAVVEQQRRTA